MRRDGLQIRCGMALAAGLLVSLLLAPGPVRSAAPLGAEQAVLPVATGQPPTTQQIDAALVALRADPNLPQETVVRTLKWRDAGQPPADRERPAWLEWLMGLFDWMARSARVLMWTLVALLAAAVAVFVIRLVRARGPALRMSAPAAPSHVRDLDIRPESLPDDIGAAASGLWRQGEQRAALALLYRGLLSRLAHRHQAPVRDSTTEDESLLLARGCLPATGADFAKQLVLTWQRAVYGGRMPVDDTVTALCGGFAAALDTNPPPGTP